MKLSTHLTLAEPSGPTPARWDEYPNLSQHEFDCRHTGQNEMKHEFLVVLQAIRAAFGRPIRVTSGYRHWTHPTEARKNHTTGEHTRGTCADIACTSSADRFVLVRLALEHGIPRIGIAKNFIHLGIGGPGLAQNVIWDYQS
jgi:zinc D-Ala-D-Ala carboxypeptidase